MLYGLLEQLEQVHIELEMLTEMVKNNPEPKPCDFKKGDRVLVWDETGYKKERRYFSHEDKHGFNCFNSGRTEWSSMMTTSWQHCIKWEEGMDE